MYEKEQQFKGNLYTLVILDGLALSEKWTFE